MSTIKALAAGLRRVDLQRQIPIMLNNQKQFAIDANKDQLLHGKTSEGADGANLRGYKSFEYAVEKNQQNSLPEFGIADLRKRGDFYNGIDLKVEATTYTLLSNDIKAPDLETHYTVFIFGLQSKNKSQWASRIYANEFMPYITSKTGLIFH